MGSTALRTGLATLLTGAALLFPVATASAAVQDTSGSAVAMEEMRSFSGTDRSFNPTEAKRNATALAAFYARAAGFELCKVTSSTERRINVTFWESTVQILCKR